MSNDTQELLGALEETPGDVELVHALERALSGAEDHASLATTLAEKASEISDSTQRARYLIVAANSAAALGDEERSLGLLQEAATLVPDGDALGQVVVAAFEEDAAWEKASSVLLTMVSSTSADDPVVRARLLFAAGKVYEDRLFNREKAVPFYNQAFKSDSSFVEPLEHARRIFREREHWGTVVKLYKAELRVTSEPQRQAEILKAIGDISLNETKDADAALKAYGMAQQVDASYPGLAEGIAAAEAVLQEDAEGVEVASELLDAPQDTGPVRTAAASRPKRAASSDDSAVPPAPATESLPDAFPAVYGEIDASSPAYVELMLKAARESSGRIATAYFMRALTRMFELDLGKGDIADTVLEAVTVADDPVVAVRDLLPALVGRRFTSDDLVNSMQEAGADGGAVYAMAFYAAGDRERANQLRAEAGDWGEIDALALEWAEKGNWRRAFKVLEEAFTQAGVADAEKEAYRLQAVLCVGLDQEDKAADSMRRVLRSNKTEHAALELSAALYASLDRAPNQADALRTLAGALQDGDNAYKGLLLRKVAKIYKDELKQDQQVMLTLQELVEVEPHNVAVMDQLAALLDEMKRYPDLVNVLNRKAEVLEDPQEQLALYKSIADLYEDKFSNPNEAIVAWEQVVSIDANNLQALERLDDLYEKRREWDKLIDIKRRRRNLAEGNEGLERLREAADIAATRMRDRDLAAQLWDEVLTADPNDARALEALEQIYDREKEYDALADVLARRVDGIEDKDERGRALLKLGQLYSDRLDEPEKALNTWVQLLELEPDNARARDSVRKAYVELGRYDDLRDFYASSDGWAEYVRQMESLAGSEEDPDKQIDLLFRASRAYIEQLDTPSRATRSLEKILKLDEGNAQAAKLLVPIYEERNDIRKLPEVLNIVLENTHDEEERYDMYVRLAELQANQLRDPESGIANYVHALHLRPNAEALYRPMLETAERANDWNSLDDAWASARAALSGDASSREQWLALTRMHGNMLEVRLKNDDEALEAADAILSEIPGDEEALSVRERIFRRREAWDDLLEVLEQQRQKAGDDSEVVDVLAEIARVHEEERDDPYAAIESYNDLLAVRPDDRTVLTSLRNLYLRTEDYASFADATRSLISDVSKGEGNALRGELAQVYVEQLDQPGLAIDVYAEILAESPTDRDAREGLMALVQNPDVEAKAARTLQPVFEGLNDWKGVVQMLEIQAAHLEDADPARIDLLSRVGELQSDTLRDYDAAFDAWARVLEAQPESARARDQVEAAAAQRRNWEDVVELYERIFENLPQGTEEEQLAAVRWGERLADLYDGQLQSLDAAIDAQQRVLMIKSDHWASRRVLANDYLPRAERWNDLVDVLLEDIHLHQDALDRRMARGKLASVYESRLGDEDSAVGIWNDIVAEDANDSEALEALDRLYEQLGDGSSQADILDRRIAQQSPGSAAQLELKLKLARLADTQLGDVDRALSLLGDVVQVSPRHEEARIYLEELLQNEDAALRASSILEPLYAEDEDDAALCRVLLARLQWEQDPEARKNVYHRVARMQARALDDHDAAFNTLERALREFPEDEDFVGQIYQEAEVAERWGDLATLLDELADVASNPDTVIDYRTRVAVLRKDYLGDVSGAADSWRQVLEDNPASHEALDALDNIYQNAEHWQELVEIVQRKADLADGDAANALHFRAASLYENQLGDADEAIEVLRGITLVDEGNARALDELHRLYEQNERWEDLVEVNDAKIRATSDARTQRDLQMERGHVLAQQLGDNDRAAEAYRAALELNPGDRAALDALDETLVRTENWDGLQEVLNQKIDIAPEGAEVDLLWRRATLRERELADLQGALADYDAILRNEPSHGDAIQALESMIGREELISESAAVLDRIYRGFDSWNDVARLNQVRLEQAYEPEKRRALLIENTDIFENRLQDGASAFDSLRRAFEEAPEAGDLNRLESLSNALENWEELESVYDQARDDAAEPAVRKDVGLRLARVREDYLDNVEGAIEAYVRVQDEQPGDPEALQNLDRLYQQTGQWETLVEVLRQRVEAASDQGVRNGLLLRQANVLQEFLEDGPEAIRVYQEVLRTDAQNDDAIAALEGMAHAGVEVEEIATILEPIYRARGAWTELVDLLQVRAQYADSPDDRYEFLSQMAHMQADSLEDPVSALQSWARALQDRAGDPVAREQIESLASDYDLWADAYEGYARVLDADTSDEDRADLARRMAKIASEHLQDEGAAEQAWLMALEVQPEDADSLQSLDALYLGQERWNELSEILHRRREVVFETDTLTELTARQARLYQGELQDINSAQTTWVEVLDLKPDHHEALKALESIYMDTESWTALYENFEQQLMLASESTERVILLRQMAQLNEQALDRPEEAIDCWNRLLAEKPGDRDALIALATLHYGAEDHQELVDTYNKLIEVADSDEERADLYRRVAGLQSWQIENDVDGVENWRKVLEILPEDEEALASLRILYQRMSDEPALARNYERQLELGYIAEDELPQVYEQLGNIYSDVLNESDKAIDAWTQVRTRVPGHQDALQRLDDLYAQNANWPDLVGVLEEKAELAEDDLDKIELYRRVAGIWTTDAPDTDKAADAWEKVVDLDLTDEQAVSELERLYTELEAWEALASLYVDRIEVIDDSWEKVATLRKAATVYRDQLGSAENAYLILYAALSEAPLDDNLRAEVEELAGASGQWEHLAQHYVSLIDQVTQENGEEDTLPLLLAVGRIRDAELEQLTSAESFYLQALEIDGENETAMVALDSIYRRNQDWDALIEIMRRRVEISYEPEEQGKLLREMSRIHEEMRAEFPDAAAVLYEALEINERDEAALNSLERIETDRGAWPELIDVLDRRLMQVYEPEEQTPLRMRIAKLWRDNVQNDEKAIDAFMDVLMGDPNNIEAMEALEELYGRNSMWDDYVEILERRATVDATPELQVELYGKQALVYEQVFEDIDRAVMAHQSSLQAIPDDINSFAELERIFEDQERWYELVETYERHAAVVEGEEQAEVLSLLGDVQLHNLENEQAALDAYENALAAHPSQEHALQSAAELSVRLERPDAAVEHWDALAAVTQDGALQRQALLSAGAILIDSLNRPSEATEHYQHILAGNPEDVEALTGLYQSYYAAEQWEEAIQAVRSRVEITPDLDIRSELIASIAQIHAEHMGDTQGARDLYEEAIDLDPTNIYAAAPLVDINIQEERWERARPLIELLLNDDRYQTEPESQAHLRYLLGRCCEELAYDSEAVEEYDKALELTPTHGDALKHMAAVQARLGRVDAAIDYQRDYLAAWQHGLEPKEQADGWVALANYQAQGSDAISAQQSYQEALSIVPDHVDALRGLVELSDESDDPALVIDAKGRLLEKSTDPEERFQLLTQLGDAYLKLGDLPRATDHYRSAVELQPNSRQALSRLLKAYQEAENWARATEVLGVLAQTEQDSARKTKLFYAIGAMYRDQLNDSENAAKFFNVALDTDPSFLQPFQDLDALLTAEHDWTGLEKAYGKMLERVGGRTDPAAVPLRKLLWKNLGEIYRSRLEKPQRAIQAFKMASDQDPSDVELLEILAALYSQYGEDPEDAISAHRRMIAQSPVRVESYRALFDAYLAKQDVDRAWNMAAALVMFNKANDRERPIYEEGLKQGVQQPRKALTREQWRAIQHPELDPLLTELMALMGSHIRPYAGDIRDHGIHRRKDRLDINEPMPISRAMQSAVRLVGNAPADMYRRREENGLRNANTEPPAVIVGHDLLQSTPERDMLFETGKMAALMRPDFYLASALLTTDYLRNVLAGAIAAVTGQIVGATDVNAAQHIAHEIQRAPEQTQARIRQAVQSILQSGENPSLSKWLRAVDHTASRVGLLLCGDLKTASRMIKDESNPIGKANTQDKIRELIIFSISEEYFEMRVELGLNIG